MPPSTRRMPLMALRRQPGRKPSPTAQLSEHRICSHTHIASDIGGRRAHRTTTAEHFWRSRSGRVLYSATSAGMSLRRPLRPSGHPTEVSNNRGPRTSGRVSGTAGTTAHPRRTRLHLGRVACAGCCVAGGPGKLAISARVQIGFFAPHVGPSSRATTSPGHAIEPTSSVPTSCGRSTTSHFHTASRPSTRTRPTSSVRAPTTRWNGGTV